MKKTLITLGVVAALSGVGMAANAESSMAARPGAYFTAGLGYISHSKEVALQKANYYSKLGFGYDFNSRFGLEADWYHGYAAVLESLSFNKLTLWGKAMYPVSDRLKLVGGAGVSYAMYDEDLPFGPEHNNNYSKIVPMVQAGVEYSASKHVGLGLNVNYSFKNGPIESATGADFGVSYHF